MDVEEENQTKNGSYCALCGLGTARTRECRVLYSCPQVVNNGVCGVGVYLTVIISGYQPLPEENLFYKFIIINNPKKKGILQFS